MRGLGRRKITGLQIRGSVFSDNGVTGLGGYRDKNVVLEDTEIARNNWRGWPAEHKGWDSVMKWLNYRDAIARRVRVVDNSGNGFWLDSDNQRVTLENSLISGNQLLGVNLEMNQGPVIIAGNRICNNMTTGVRRRAIDELHPPQQSDLQQHPIQHSIHGHVCRPVGDRLPDGRDDALAIGALDRNREHDCGERQPGVALDPHRLPDARSLVYCPKLARGVQQQCLVPQRAG